jgi:DNA-binding NarL/FixJ family response regulator
MSSRPVRILIAEDHPLFRRFLASTVQSRPGVQVVCEVPDGLEAVQKVRELEPELVLLDIGLPGQNGIEAARQIRKFSPQSKILFVTQEASADFVHAALETGAWGYVTKTDAGHELLPALEALLRGQKYMSKSVAEHGFMKTATLAPDQAEALSGFSRSEASERPRCHEVGFFSDDDALLGSFADFLAAALQNGNAGIVITTELQQIRVLSRLEAYGLDMSAAIRQGRYVALDTEDALSRYMVYDRPDDALFYRAADDLITKTAKAVDGERTRVVACGECAPLLWERGNVEEAIRLERLWDEIARSHGVQVLCGYQLATCEGEKGRDTFDRICAEHSAVRSKAGYF